MSVGRLSTLAFFVSTLPAFADVPDVVTDIPPVHGLVSRVMQGVGEPVLLLDKGASPHDYALRPSNAAALQDAELVIWTGEGLAPWLADTIGSVAPNALSLPLANLEQTVRLPFREGATFEAHDHDHGHEHEDGHEDEDHHDDEHAHDDEHGHDDHDEDHAHDDHDEDSVHDDHAHEGDDPHMWLDPENGKIWLSAIADALSKQDPEHADLYAANATAGQAEIDEASARIAAKLAPLSDLHFIVFHDAYHYFEARFGVEAVGAISMSDASTPSPKRITEVRDTVDAMDVTCALSEPQFNAKLIDTVLGDHVAARAVIDPLGAHLDNGPEFYIELLDHIAEAFVSCQ
ncbi:zinc ABC transporter substrate-binding protein [Celeribacter sp.]|uniref:zinc ABC transporter substrate-binding protein n=1 Tax=Celeribacter sp. TaxID=1890673 RepID=UPI003A948274